MKVNIVWILIVVGSMVIDGGNMSVDSGVIPQEGNSTQMFESLGSCGYEISWNQTVDSKDLFGCSHPLTGIPAENGTTKENSTLLLCRVIRDLVCSSDVQSFQLRFNTSLSQEVKEIDMFCSNLEVKLSKNRLNISGLNASMCKDLCGKGTQGGGLSGLCLFINAIPIGLTPEKKVNSSIETTTLKSEGMISSSPSSTPGATVISLQQNSTLVPVNTSEKVVDKIITTTTEPHMDNTTSKKVVQNVISFNDTKKPHVNSTTAASASFSEDYVFVPVDYDVSGLSNDTLSPMGQERSTVRVVTEKKSRTYHMEYILLMVGLMLLLCGWIYRRSIIALVVEGRHSPTLRRGDRCRRRARSASNPRVRYHQLEDPDPANSD